MKHNKLVRDYVPDRIEDKGGNPVFHVAEEKEFWEKLKEKLAEEVKEFQESEALEEIADILEVIEAITEYKHFSFAEIQDMKKSKAKQRGRFEKRIILEES